MIFELLETQQLILRKLTPETYDYLFQQYNDNELKAFLGLVTEEELEKEKDKFRKGIATYNKSFVNFQLIDKQTNTVMGACGFHTWYTEHRRAEIGYALNSDVHKGKGIMSEALKAVIDYGFREMDLNRIEAFIGPKNEPSLRLVQKLNFTKEGHLRKHYCKNNIMEDSLVFSLLRDEYLH
ncbi:acetyltransferase, ribosomal protein N-acetylase [Flavobacterium saliperosum S13]|uniref:Ribosomal-protein-alanine N-acetyltransferase n=2 Tax=Flavobacterium saliperosum TaxID=329186 RepID=A0A1G4VZP7_9FLAO|nr:GNAT family protein [Flavobacterium saliperosum]ESU27429.1 acetyltransferase, ribosomal protein N-acetylase [Flavobacterium saliperosum S13]SCX14460.1 ribosomal-protein-alanine N-acetyltransferase [Flavobacterium saliperosum]